MPTTLDPCIEHVKSRLLPLSPWERPLEWLVERLPRRLIRIELTPNDDIVTINESKGEYKASTNTPSFTITLTPPLSQGGWYYLETALVRNNGNREAYIRADAGGDGREMITIPIPTNLRGTVREVIFLPPRIRSLHWLPTAAPGFFSQSQLLLHRITPLESTLRRFYRVLFDLWRFKSRSPAARMGLTWKGTISNLQDTYQRSAALRSNRLRGDDYPSFITLNDTLKKSDILAINRQIPQLRHHPVISLIMQVHTPIATFFTEAIQSVCQQFYPHWELLLVGDFSDGTESHKIGKQFQCKNDQIKMISVESGGNLAATLNRALGVARGEFVARIDQHDRIPPQALFFLAKIINKHPEIDLVYADDDSIDGDNRRLAPRFKPDWNPDLFTSCNYLGNPTFYRLERVRDLGGYRSGLDGAEDYDLTLRYLKDIPTIKIQHITRILYHRRIISPAEIRPLAPHQVTDWSEDQPAHTSGKRALETFFEDTGTIVKDGPAPELYRIEYPLPPESPLVSIIIPTRDRGEILKICIDSIRQKTTYANWEILVVDNQSTEEATLAYLTDIQQDFRIRVLRYQKPFNYSAINNFAARHAKGEILALLNNDVEVIAPDWLTEMVSHAIRPGVGAVGAKLLYSNGTVQHAGVILGLGGVAGHGHRYIKDEAHGYCHRAAVVQNLSALTGACLVVRKSVYEEVGGFNAADFAVAFNDVDFCLKLLVKGYRNVFTPYSRLYHYESMSRGHDDTPEKQALFEHEYNRMKTIWGKRLEQDPAYNPNLTMEFEDFSLKM